MRACLLAFVAGCWWLQQQALLPSWHGYAWLLAGALVVASVVALGAAPAWRARRRVMAHAPARSASSAVGWMRARMPVRSLRTVAMATVLAFVLGAAWANWRAAVRIAAWLPKSLAGQNLVLTGEIAGLPDVAAHGTRFLFAPDPAVDAREASDPTGASGASTASSVPNAPDAPDAPNVTSVASVASVASAPDASDAFSATSAIGATSAASAIGAAGATSVSGVTGMSGMSGMSGMIGAIGATGATARIDGIPARVLLSWRNPPVPLVPGQRWQLNVRLKRPRGLANPHGFDYAYWLLGEGIGATGYVRAARVGPMAGDGARIARWRAALRDRMQAALPADARLGGVLVALAIGDQRGIAQTDWDIFRRTGVSHLVSISGLHITMLSGAVGGMVHWLWRHSFGLGRRLRRPLPLWWPARQAALVAAVATALAYGLIAGMQIPAMRTVAMLTVAAVALWSGRAPPPTLILTWAAAVAIAIDPWAVMAPGFWLSFGAVAVIFLTAARPDAAATGSTATRRRRSTKAASAADDAPAQDRAAAAARVFGGLPGAGIVANRKPHGVAAHAAAGADDGVGSGVEPVAADDVAGEPSALRRRFLRWRAALVDAARVQWAVTVGLVPFSLLLFGQVSVVSAVANAVAIPIVSLVVTPLSLLGAVAPLPVARIALAAAHSAMAWLADGLAWLAAPAWAVWEAAQAGPIALVLASIGVCLLLLPEGDRAMRAYGALLMTPMIVASGTPVAEGEMRVTALDIGQGTAVLVETRSHALLYDTGPAYLSGTSAGAQVVVPYLRATGVRRLDRLVVSHEDADHAGGVRDIEAAVPIGSRDRDAGRSGEAHDAEAPAPIGARDRDATPSGDARYAEAAAPVGSRDRDAGRSGEAHDAGAPAPIGTRDSDAELSGEAHDVDVPIGARLTGAPLGQPWMTRSWMPCEAGMAWTWDGVRFEVLHPPATQAGNARVASNARSCVLRVATAHRSVLLTGDIGVAEERAMVRRAEGDGATLRADILVVPHHGSGTSSGAALLRAVAPEVAVFQLGYRNRYGHPRADVWARYAARGIERYRTDEAGAITIVTRGDAYDVTAYRQQVRRYWRDAPPAPR